MQTTLQDEGRPGWQAVGVSPSGAMDPVSLQLANLLAGAPRDAVAIEATLVGPVLQALDDITLGIAGSMPPRLDTPQRLRLKRGDQLDLRQLIGGSRCYVGIAGGLTCDMVLDSGATDLRAGWGGMQGRALAAGDLLGVKQPTLASPLNITLSPFIGSLPLSNATVELRFLPGLQTEGFSAAGLRQFRSSEYQISNQSDRMGLRCTGPPVTPPQADQVPSQPVTYGTIQIPPDGQPVILGADRQTVGGYPVIGCVITADLPKLGQLAPGSTIRFQEISLNEAERLRRETDQALAIAATGIALREQQP